MPLISRHRLEDDDFFIAGLEIHLAFEIYFQQPSPFIKTGCHSYQNPSCPTLRAPAAAAVQSSGLNHSPPGLFSNLLSALPSAAFLSPRPMTFSSGFLAITCFPKFERVNLLGSLPKSLLRIKSLILVPDNIEVKCLSKSLEPGLPPGPPPSGLGAGMWTRRNKAFFTSGPLRAGLDSCNSGCGALCV